MQDRQPLAALHRSWSSLAINRAKSGLRPGPVLFLALQLAILALAWRLLGQQGNTPSLHAPAAAAAAGGAAAAAPPGGWRVTSDLNEWSRAPWNLTFKPPQSQCLLHPDGTVELAEGWADPERPPFLFDTSSMPLRDTACPHCPADEKPPLCCGVCIFESRRCDGFYPGQGRSEAVAQHMLGSGYNLKAFSPCELFQRIRGRTLWFMGDSQTWHYYYSAECFLREFAHNLIRKGAVEGRWDGEANKKLITVTWPVHVPPICLEYALGTRVCAMRVDSAEVLMKTVLPMLQAQVPNFNNDLMIFNTGLHYAQPGDGGKPPGDSDLVRHMTALTSWRQRNAAALPRFIWMDAPHFTGSDGSYNGGEKPFRCAPLRAWYSGDATVRAGGRRNSNLAHLIPQLADAHLRTWNASVPLWNTHKPDECTHWCSPSAYHMWLYLLNNLLQEGRLGSAAHVPQRTPDAAAAEAAAVAGAETAAAHGLGGNLHVFT